MHRWLHRRLRTTLPAIVFLLLFTIFLGGPGRMSTPLAAADAPTVTIVGFEFQPATLTISPGETVTWTNTDGAMHNVVASDGSFSSPLLSKGDTLSFTFTTLGTCTYQCTLHAWMTGTIVVAAPGAAPTARPLRSVDPSTRRGRTP